MNEYTNYIRERIEKDVLINRTILGRDCSRELGMALNLIVSLYRSQDPDEDFATMDSFRYLVKLPKIIEEERGLRVSFYQTTKCVLAVNRVWKERQKEGLTEILEYVDELLSRPLEHRRLE